MKRKATLYEGLVAELENSMSVLVVHPYLDVLGGAEHVCFHTIKALVDGGYDVTLASEHIRPEQLKKVRV